MQHYYIGSPSDTMSRPDQTNEGVNTPLTESSFVHIEATPQHNNELELDADAHAADVFHDANEERANIENHQLPPVPDSPASPPGLNQDDVHRTRPVTNSFQPRPQRPLTGPAIPLPNQQRPSLWSHYTRPSTISNPRGRSPDLVLSANRARSVDTSTARSARYDQRPRHYQDLRSKIASRKQLGKDSDVAAHHELNGSHNEFFPKHRQAFDEEDMHTLRDLGGFETNSVIDFHEIVETLGERLYTVTGERDMLQHALDNSNTRNRTLMSSSKSQSDQALRQERDAAVKECEQLRARIIELQTGPISVCTKCEDYRVLVRQLETKIALLEAQIDKSANSEADQNAKEALIRENTALAEKFNALESEHTDTMIELDQVRDSYREERDRFLEGELTLEQAITEIEHLQVAQEDLKDRLENSDRDGDGFQVALSDLRAKKIQLETDLSLAKKNIDKLENDLVRSQGCLKSCTDGRSDDRRTHEARVANIRQQLTALENKYRELEASHAKVTDERNKFRRDSIMNSVGVSSSGDEGMRNAVADLAARIDQINDRNDRSSRDTLPPDFADILGAAIANNLPQGWSNSPDGGGGGGTPGGNGGANTPMANNGGHREPGIVDVSKVSWLAPGKLASLAKQADPASIRGALERLRQNNTFMNNIGCFIKGTFYNGKALWAKIDKCIADIWEFHKRDDTEPIVKLQDGSPIAEAVKDNGDYYFDTTVFTELELAHIDRLWPSYREILPESILTQLAINTSPEQESAWEAVELLFMSIYLYQATLQNVLFSDLHSLDRAHTLRLEHAGKKLSCQTLCSDITDWQRDAALINYYHNEHSLIHNSPVISVGTFLACAQALFAEVDKAELLQVYSTNRFDHGAGCVIKANVVLDHIMKVLRRERLGALRLSTISQTACPLRKCPYGKWCGYKHGSSDSTDPKSTKPKKGSRGDTAAPKVNQQSTSSPSTSTSTSAAQLTGANDVSVNNTAAGGRGRKNVGADPDVPRDQLDCYHWQAGRKHKLPCTYKHDPAKEKVLKDEKCQKPNCRICPKNCCRYGLDINGKRAERYVSVDNCFSLDPPSLVCEPCDSVAEHRSLSHPHGDENPMKHEEIDDPITDITTVEQVGEQSSISVTQSSSPHVDEALQRRREKLRASRANHAKKQAVSIAESSIEAPHDNIPMTPMVSQVAPGFATEEIWALHDPGAQTNCVGKRELCVMIGEDATFTASGKTRHAKHAVFKFADMLIRGLYVNEQECPVILSGSFCSWFSEILEKRGVLEKCHAIDRPDRELRHKHSDGCTWLASNHQDNLVNIDFAVFLLGGANVIVSEDELKAGNLDLKAMARQDQLARTKAGLLAAPPKIEMLHINDETIVLSDSSDEIIAPVSRVLERSYQIRHTLKVKWEDHQRDLGISITNANQVKKVTAGSAAHHAGFYSGARIVSIGGFDVPSDTTNARTVDLFKGAAENNRSFNVVVEGPITPVPGALSSLPSVGREDPPHRDTVSTTYDRNIWSSDAGEEIALPEGYSLRQEHQRPNSAHVCQMFMGGNCHIGHACPLVHPNNARACGGCGSFTHGFKHCPTRALANSQVQVVQVKWDKREQELGITIDENFRVTNIEEGSVIWNAGARAKVGYIVRIGHQYTKDFNRPLDLMRSLDDNRGNKFEIEFHLAYPHGKKISQGSTRPSKPKSNGPVKNNVCSPATHISASTERSQRVEPRSVTSSVDFSMASKTPSPISSGSCDPNPNIPRTASSSPNVESVSMLRRLLRQRLKEDAHNRGSMYTSYEPDHVSRAANSIINELIDLRQSFQQENGAQSFHQGTAPSNGGAN